MDDVEQRRRWARLIDQLDREREDPAYAGLPAPPPPPPDLPRPGRGARACRLSLDECDYLDRLEGK